MSQTVAPPRSKKLEAELRESTALVEAREAAPEVTAKQGSTTPVGGRIQIQPIRCCNDFVAILQSEVTSPSGLVLMERDRTKPEGVVVGVGPGVISGNGRVPPQVKLGDVVLFNGQSIVKGLKPDTGFYAGKDIILVSDRNLYCVLRTLDVEEITA